MAKKKTKSERYDDSVIVVAGEGADGFGVMCSFGGDGPLTRARILELARGAAIEETWFPPAKDAKVQLTRAVESVCRRHGMKADKFLKKNNQGVEAREWASCWRMISSNPDADARPGDAAGSITLIVTLYDDVAGQELLFEPAEHAYSLEVRAEFDALTGAELMNAGDITSWLSRIHRDMLGGVRLGLGWYVPPEHRSIAEAIADSFWENGRYGHSWTSPPVPVQTSRQLQRGLAAGLCDELTAQLGLLEGQRRKVRNQKGGHDRLGRFVPIDARAELTSDAYAYALVENDGGRSFERVDIGANAARSFAERFARVWRRINDYAERIGPALVDECAARMHDAMVELNDILDGGSTNVDGSFRDVLAEDEAAEEAARNASQPETSFAGVAS